MPSETSPVVQGLKALWEYERRKRQEKFDRLVRSKERRDRLGMRLLWIGVAALLALVLFEIYTNNSG